MQGYSESFDFFIMINSPYVDIQEMEELTIGLRQELLDLNLENVDLVREKDIPDRAKVVEPISWGILLIKLAASGSALTMLIKTLERWVMIHKTSINIEYEGKKLSINGFIPPEERKQLIDNWIDSLPKES